MIPRISQLDAVEFDNSIRNLLASQVFDVGKFLKPGLLNPVKPELHLIVDLLILKNSLLKGSATFGQQLMELHYLSDVTRSKLFFYTICNAALPYIRRRCEESLPTGSKSVRSAIDGLYNFGKLASLLNLLLFLREGMYPTVADRLLRLKYSSTKRLNRNVGYNYMARELLWHGFMEFLMFTIPLINTTSIKRQIKSILSRPPPKVQVPPPTLDVTSICSICSLRPVIPCRVSIYCPHIACYVCLKGSTLTDAKLCCPDCGVENTATCHFQFIAV